MYITAQWVTSPQATHSVNAAVYKHENGLPFNGDPIQIAQDPGPVSKQYIDIQGGRVRAYLDIILEDSAYTADRIQRALDTLYDRIVGDTENPIKTSTDVPGSAPIQLVYWINAPYTAPDSKQLILKMLGEPLLAWLRRDFPDIPTASAA